MTKVLIDLDNRIVAELDKLYLDSRYPGEFGLLPSGKPTLEEATGYYDEAANIRNQIGIILSA